MSTASPAPAPVQQPPQQQQQQQQKEQPVRAPAAAAATAGSAPKAAVAAAAGPPKPAPAAPPPAGGVSWRSRTSAFATETARDRFSVMSWNCLAQVYIDPPRYGAIPQQYLRWPHRRELLLARIRAQNPDIVCLQETEIQTFDADYATPLALSGYTAVLQLDKGRASGHPTANAVLFKASKFKSVWVDPRSRAVLVGLQLLPPPPASAAPPAAADTKQPAGASAALSAAGSAAVSAAADTKAPAAVPNGAAAASASGAAAGESGEGDAPPTYVFVANVHLEGHPDKVDVRISQVSSLLKALHKVQTHLSTAPLNNRDTEGGVAPPSRVAPEYSHTIVCGDFNEREHECVYDFLTGRVVEAGVKDPDFGVVLSKTRLEHTYTFDHAYSGADSATGKKHLPPYSFVGMNMALQVSPGVLDFIYFNAPGLRLLERVHVVGDAVEQKLQCSALLPNATHPSDHLPIAACFEFVRVPLLAPKAKRDADAAATALALQHKQRQQANAAKKAAAKAHRKATKAATKAAGNGADAAAGAAGDEPSPSATPPTGSSPSRTPPRTPPQSRTPPPTNAGAGAAAAAAAAVALPPPAVAGGAAAGARTSAS